jgi:hypothetical protein
LLTVVIWPHWSFGPVGEWLDRAGHGQIIRSALAASVDLRHGQCQRAAYGASRRAKKLGATLLAATVLLEPNPRRAILDRSANRQGASDHRPPAEFLRLQESRERGCQAQGDPASRDSTSNSFALSPQSRLSDPDKLDSRKSKPEPNTQNGKAVLILKDGAKECSAILKHLIAAPSAASWASR